MSDEDDADCAFSMRNGVKWRARHFILSKYQSFIVLNDTISAVQNFNGLQQTALIRLPNRVTC